MTGYCMKVRLGQIFYGMGTNGYAVLGASPSANGLESAVETMCGMVGTPHVALDGSAVLMSHVVGDRVILARACAGALDPNGRRTLFFHAMVARVSELEASGIDAFAISDKGMFLSSLPGDAKADLELETAQVAAARTSPPFDVSFPAVFRLAKPDTPLMRAILGSRANRLTWTTFAETANPFFDLCAVDEYAALPSNRAIYDVRGLVRGASPGRAPQADLPSEGDFIEERPSGGSAVLKVSLLLNVALVAVCAFFLLRGKDGADVRQAATPAAPTVAAGRATAGAEPGEDIAALRKVLDGFARENIIADWDDVVAQSPFLQKMKDPNPGKEKQKKDFERIDANIRFVKRLFDFYSNGEQNK